ncbi:MAG TPA: hypothetical protein VHH72_06830 [Solirubrobacterales bacterium]|jgi:hypothetical protein|nr:hypothetical protein [Solirubrobacterales bacterium]
MTKMFRKRPSPAMIVGIVALIAALSGGAYAATQKKVEYKGLSKDARLKVLPFSKTATGTDCNPTAAATYTDCATVNVDGSTGFPRKYYVSFNGVFDGVGGPLARGDCRLEADNNPIPGTTIRIEQDTHTGEHGDGSGINVVTTPLGGKHAISVACNENAGDLRVHQFQLSAFQVR